MSISQKQLEANRKNSQLGGVKTEEGKEIVKHNALKHGLLAKEVLLEGENKKELDELSESVVNSLKPDGELENILAERIISNTWRLKRCLKIERNLMEYEKNNELGNFDIGGSAQQSERSSILGMVSSHLMDRIMRYETTIERGIFKSLHELERIQAKKKGEAVNSPIAIDVDISQEN